MIEKQKAEEKQKALQKNREDELRKMINAQNQKKSDPKSNQPPLPSNKNLVQPAKKSPRGNAMPPVPGRRSSRDSGRDNNSAGKGYQAPPSYERPSSRDVAQQQAKQYEMSPSRGNSRDRARGSRYRAPSSDGRNCPGYGNAAGRGSRPMWWGNHY